MKHSKYLLLPELQQPSIDECMRARRKKKMQKKKKKKEKKKKKKKKKKEEKRKDGPGPVMVSDTLCPAVHILGT